MITTFIRHLPYIYKPCIFPILAQLLNIWKYIPDQQLNFEKILNENTTILKQQSSLQRLEILEALPIRNKRSNLNKINFETTAKVLKCL